jgi:hypothetical protein
VSAEGAEEEEEGGERSGERGIAVRTACGSWNMRGRLASISWKKKASGATRRGTAWGSRKKRVSGTSGSMALGTWREKVMKCLRSERHR